MGRFNRQISSTWKADGTFLKGVLDNRKEYLLHERPTHIHTWLFVTSSGGFEYLRAAGIRMITLDSFSHPIDPQ